VSIERERGERGGKETDLSSFDARVNGGDEDMV
jgi:hypothetical protein